MSAAATTGLPSRLHHTAYVVRDQLATRAFYEGLIGLPLLATWCEVDELFGAERVYCHTFYGLGDGSALAFFQFEKQSDYDEFGPRFRPSPFIHVALKVDGDTQTGIEARLVAAGADHFVLEHGYCRSLYVTDPDGLILEFTLDHPEADSISALRRKLADADLQRWLAGDHSSNNTYRSETG
jgi:catechol 2,3-dioxygenase-like lactoylglutathione lyase family enzyme